MTIEEYLVDVRRIYYLMSVIVDGKQILASPGHATHRLTDIRDSKGKLNTIRFSALSLPAATEIGETSFDHAVINFGGVHLVIWPIKEDSNA